MVFPKEFTVIDKAMKTKLSACTINSTLVPAIYINPEEEFVVETFPSIVFYRTSVVQDKQRTCTDVFKDNPVITGGNLMQLSERKAPLAMKILYNIRLFYQYQSDGVILNAFMLKNFPPRPYPCFLNVVTKDAVYNASNELVSAAELFPCDLEYINSVSPQSSSKFFGTINEATEERTFCDQHLYWCEIDLDLFDRVVVKTVQEVIPTVDKLP